MLKKSVIILGALFLSFAIFVHTSPVVVLHYAAAAPEPVTFFLNRDDNIVKDHLKPGEQRAFRTPHRPDPDYYLDVSLPFASRDGVEIKPPFSRVDVYIGADTRITRTVVRTDFRARFGSK